MKARKLSSFSILIFLFFTAANIKPQSTMLVDFGSDAGQNTFQLENWNNLLLNADMSYSSEGPGGVYLSQNIDELTDYMGVKGVSRHFIPGERIVVTWYNNSDETIRFTSRISFTDEDQPEGGASEGSWYTMRSFADYRETYAEIEPHLSAKTAFNITSQGVHKTDGEYSLVNINLTIEWYDAYMKQFLICDKIELYDDADIVPPDQPTGITAAVLSDSKIYLDWNDVSDNTGTAEYLVYNGGSVEGYTRLSDYTGVFLEPSMEYTFSVTALDMSGNESTPSELIVVSTNAYNHSNDLINPAGIIYAGSFYLPEEFSWGAEAVTYCIDGDGGPSGAGASDGYPGSLFVMNLNQPENGLVAEVSVTQPVIPSSKDIEQLKEVSILQTPVNIRPDNVNNLEFVDIWRTGLKYIGEQNRLYSAWNIYFTVTGEKHPTISFCNSSDLADSYKYGAWHVGPADEWPVDAAIGDYLFRIDNEWEQLFNNYSLVTGRYREGGLSGLGPAMYAFDLLGNDVPEPGSELNITTLLQYGPVEESDNYNFPNSIDGYNHADWWRDADWIYKNDQAAVVVIGNKARGDNWYGYHGENMRHDWVIADLPYPEFFETDPDGKGWRSHNLIPMAVFFNPQDLADVANRSKESYEPQPYAALRFNKNIFWGDRAEIFSACYDEYNHVLFIAEFVYEMDGRIIIHTFDVDNITGVAYNNNLLPDKINLEQNYPNPFNLSTAIEYTVAAKSGLQRFPVILKVYDVLGRIIDTLVDELQKSGKYKIEFDGSGLSSGIYYYRLSVGKYNTSEKMILIK
ncbi:MAG: T9SS type A sorting domain-containing protein [Melioribacteraceae bacterium]|nr:T9SS type A sorting domain-containing protein [Melioribacteraceae bacterium]